MSPTRSAEKRSLVASSEGGATFRASVVCILGQRAQYCGRKSERQEAA